MNTLNLIRPVANSGTNAPLTPRARPHSMRVTAMAVLAVSMALFGQCAHADEEAQRERLARISYELSRLELLAADASKEQESSARTRFRFDWLIRDLAMVRRGIEDHADAPRQPRPVPPLRGDYRP
jgi:RAQPRD family integrative conjugative element protein